MKCDCVVVARGRGLVAFRWPLEKYSQGLRAVAPCRRDARCEAIACGRANDEHVLRAGLAAGNFSAHAVDPALDIAAASLRMSIHTDKAARAALDDLLWHIRVRYVSASGRPCPPGHRGVATNLGTLDPSYMISHD